MLGAAAVLTAVIVVYHGYGEGAKQVATALADLASDAFGDGAGGREGAGIRRRLWCGSGRRRSPPRPC